MKNIPLLRDRLQVLESMGLAMDAFLDPNSTVASTAIAAAGQSNPWFTEAEIRRAVSAIRPWLRTPVLMQWLSDEKIPDEPLLPKNVGIIMAGNIPMVNFLDALAVWLSGHKVCSTSWNARLYGRIFRTETQRIRCGDRHGKRQFKSIF